MGPSILDCEKVEMTYAANEAEAIMGFERTPDLSSFRMRDRVDGASFRPVRGSHSPGP